VKPGDWVWVEGYDDEDATRALVVATSMHKEVVKRAEANRAIAEKGYVHVRDVTWRSVLVSDHDDIGDECEFHESGTGRRWVEAALCIEASVPSEDTER
jgi:protein-disulfide isomerase-like protein with CxxC motif